MESKYKVGDKVTIKNLHGAGGSDYRFGLNSDMCDMSGKTYTIREVKVASTHAGKIPDDGYRYELEEISRWAWASSMFEDSSEALSLEASIDNSLDAFIAKKKCPKLDFTL